MNTRVVEFDQSGVWVALNALNDKMNALSAGFNNILTERDSKIADLENTITVLLTENRDLKNSVDNFATVCNRLEKTDYVTNDSLITFGYITPDDLKQLTARIDELQDDKEIKNRVRELCNSITDVEKQVSEIISRFDDLPEPTDVSEIENLINTRFDDLPEPTDLSDLTCRIDAIILDVDKRFNDLPEQPDISEIINDVDEIRRTVSLHNSTLTGHDNQLNEMFSTVSNYRQENTELAERFNRTMSNYRQENTELAERFNQLSATVCSLPKNLVINSDGDLVGVSGTGDFIKIGNVSVPGISDVRLVSGRLEVILQDGRRIDAGEVAKTVENSSKKSDFIKWLESQEKIDTMTINSTAEKYGVTVQTVYRWIRKSGQGDKLQGSDKNKIAA